MANIPYYGLRQGGMGQANLNKIEDPYQGLREGVSSLQKFVEQKETVETSKLLAEARSNWNIRLNELQKEKGLDAEGFSSLVEQEMADYENNIMSRVPFSQREKFSAEFAGLKYDMLTKSSIYEADALSKKMVNDVNETIEFNANTILSDPTQRQRVIDDTDDLIDDLNIAESAKEELKNGAREKFAISEINALTERNADLLLHNLNSGVYDKDITSKQKAAALSQAQRKIEYNKKDVELKKKQKFDEEYNVDLEFATTNATLVDIQNMRSKYAYSDWKKLYDAWSFVQDKGISLVDTGIKLSEGRINCLAKSDQRSLNNLYDYQISSKDETGNNIYSDFVNRKALANELVGKTGFMSDSYSLELRNMLNSNDYQNKANAGVSFLEAKQINSSLITSLTKNEQDKLLMIGYAVKSGYDPVDAVKKAIGDIDSNTEKERTDKYNKMFEKGDVEGDLSVDIPEAQNDFLNIYKKWYIQTGDEDLAQKMGEDYVNSYYAINVIGSGEAGIFEGSSATLDMTQENDFFRMRFRAKNQPMFRPPMIEYGSIIKADSEQEKIEILAKDLLSQVKSTLKGGLINVDEIKYEDIVIYNDNKAFNTENGKPAYQVTYKGAPLINEDGDIMYWIPNITGYLENEGDK